MLRFTSIIRMVADEKLLLIVTALRLVLADLSPTDTSGADTGWVKAD